MEIDHHSRGQEGTLRFSWRLEVFIERKVFLIWYPMRGRRIRKRDRVEAVLFPGTGFKGDIPVQ